MAFSLLFPDGRQQGNGVHVQRQNGVENATLGTRDDRTNGLRNASKGPCAPAPALTSKFPDTAPGRISHRRGGGGSWHGSQSQSEPHVRYTSYDLWEIKCGQMAQLPPLFLVFGFLLSLLWNE